MSLINRIAHDLNRAFAMFDDPLFAAARRLPTFPSSLVNTTGFFRPSVDVSETDKNYTVEAEVPGMKKEDLSVEFLDDDTLVLKGKVERTKTEGEGLRTVDTTKGEGSVSASGEPSATDVIESTSELSANIPTYWSNERSIGSFQRSFRFPGKIDSQKVKANYKDGVLYVNIPKAEHQSKKVDIE